jgi:hypothetical protein
VVLINSSLLNITLYNSVITTQNIQSLSWRYNRVRLHVCTYVCVCVCVCIDTHTHTRTHTHTHIYIYIYIYIGNCTSPLRIRRSRKRHQSKQRWPNILLEYTMHEQAYSWQYTLETQQILPSKHERKRCVQHSRLAHFSNTMYEFHSVERPGKHDAFRYQNTNAVPCSTHQFLTFRSVPIDFGFGRMPALFFPSGHVYAMRLSWLQSWRKDRDKKYSYKNMQRNVHSETKIWQPFREQRQRAFDIRVVPEDKHRENSYNGRSQWPRSLKRRYVAKRLLGSWVRIPPEAWMFVLYSVCVVK